MHHVVGVGGADDPADGKAHLPRDETADGIPEGAGGDDKVCNAIHSWAQLKVRPKVV